LPVSAEAVSQKVTPIPLASRTGEGRTVLVVEDEADVRNGVTRALEQSGFAVLAAEDGVAAVAVFRQHRSEIGCVLCDLTMPRMNGWQTLSALRQLAPGFPVILASGYSEDYVMAGDHPELPQVLLHKPYDLQQLCDAINRLAQCE
jgi:CheY-like chemotaxis protein